MRLKFDRGHLYICLRLTRFGSIKVYYMAKQTGLDEIQAKIYKVKTFRARKHIHNTFEPGAPSRLVQSLNSLFYPPPIGAEPGRAKRESRITCMRMLRTNQSKITRVLTRLLASMCRAMPFSARALKKKQIFFGVDIVVKNIKT